MPAEQLSDGRLIGGLLIAAASAAGLGHVGLPSVRNQTDGGVSAVLLLESGHIAVQNGNASFTVAAGEHKIELRK